jgi:hypothetical protein
MGVATTAVVGHRQRATAVATMFWTMRPANDGQVRPEVPIHALPFCSEMPIWLRNTTEAAVISVCTSEMIVGFGQTDRLKNITRQSLHRVSPI